MSFSGGIWTVRASIMSLRYGMYIVLYFVHLHVNSTVALTIIHKTTVLENENVYGNKCNVLFQVLEAFVTR